MKALVYGGPGVRMWEEVPDPRISDPEDAIVRVDVVTICGTDLHILKGDVPRVEPGRVLGHEAVGVPETFTLCAELVRPGGHVANIGVHGSSAELHLETLWDKDVTITTGLVDTSSTPTLLRLVAAGRLTLPGIITHRFGIQEMQDAYDAFSDSADTGALKVVLYGDQAVLRDVD